MKLKKMLAAVLTMAMVATALPVTAFAEEANTYSVGTGKTYETMDAAVAQAKEEDATNVVYEIYGKVVITAGEGYAIADNTATNVKFVGKTDDAELYLNSTNAGSASGYIVAPSGTDVSFEKLIISKGGRMDHTYNIGQLGNYWGVWSDADVFYTYCNFPEGVATFAPKTTFVECDFTNDTSGKYNLWTYPAPNSDGPAEIIVDQCTFTGTRGIKAYVEGNDTSLVASGRAPQLKVTNSKFESLTEKPAVAGTIATSIYLEGNTYTYLNTEAGAELGLMYVDNKVGAMTGSDFNLVKAIGIVDGDKTYFTSVAAAEAAGATNIEVAVVKNTTTDAMYFSLADAVAAAKDGNVITLLDSVSGSGIVIDKDITIDFGGKTYTFTTPAVGSEGTTTNGFQILKNNDVVLKNGGLKVADANAAEYYILIQNYANLTVEDMTLDGTNLDRWSKTDGDSYVLSNNSGNVVVKDTKITVNNDGDKAFAFDVCKFQSYAAPVVTMSGDMEVNGDFEVSKGLEKNLKISGGKFKTEPTAYLVGGYTATEADGWWTVVEIEDVTVDTTVDTIVSAPAIDTGSVSIPEENITAAKTQEQDATSKESLTTAANNVTVTVTEEEVKAALPANVVAEAAEQQKEITVEKQTYLDMQVESFVDNTLTVEIKAMCQPVATVTLGEGNTAETKTAPIGEPEVITVTKPVTVTIPLPDDFEVPADKTVYVRHYKENGELVAVHKAIVDAEGKTATFVNEHGFSTFVVTDTPSVAAVGETPYSTLAAAITNAAASGDTIKLMMNVALDASVDVRKTITLDLNGFEITSTTNSAYGAIYVSTAGNLTIEDNSTAKTGAITATNTYAVGNYGTVTVKGGKLTGGTDCAALYNFYANDTTYGKSTIDGGNVDTVWNCGELQVDDGNVGYIDNSGAAVVTGGTIGDIFAQDGGDASGVGTGSVTMTGGAVSGTIDAETNAGVMISGGSFAEEVDLAMLAPNANRVTNANGSSEVLTDADLTDSGNSLTLEAGEKLVDDEGKVLLNVTQGSATYSNGEITAEAGTVLNTTANGTVSFPNGGTIDEDGNVTYEPAPSTSSNRKSSKKYSASVDKDDIENGTVKLSSTSAKKGATVTITVTPDEGYELDELKVLDDDGNEIEVKDKGNGKFTFVMPRGGVEIEASFVEGEAAPVVPADKEESLVLTINQLFYMLNGKYEANDVAPIIKGDRTFLPIRLIAEFLGATVTWSEAEQSVTIVKDDTTIVIYIGQAFALVNGEPVQLDEAAFIENDRTYLPLRFIAENLGAAVVWDGTNNTVTITK